MSKKNSNVILKNSFKNFEELYKIYCEFYKNLSLLKKKSILIAVSGGPDSLALSALAKAYSYKKKCKIYYVLVDHNLRKGSTKEALKVKKLLKNYKINLHILKNKKLINKNIQSQARKIRYELLNHFCEKKKITTILTAHNLEDQVETFFIRLSRGSGLQGLSSMRSVSKLSRKVNLFRPLLEFKKDQLIKISRIIFGKYYIDPTNKNIKYLRTRIRNLRKSLETSGINYDQIFRSIKNLSSSRDTLELYFNKIYQDVSKISKNKIIINLKKFNNLNQEIKMMVVQQSIKNLAKPYYLPRSKKTLSLIERIKIKKNSQFTLGGCLIVRQNNQLLFKKERKN